MPSNTATTTTPIATLIERCDSPDGQAELQDIIGRELETLVFDSRWN